MIVHRDLQQHSLEWLQARAGVVTASGFDQLLTPEFKIRTGQMPLSYVALKVAERWRGGPIEGTNTIDMELGRILEDDAIPYYTLVYGEEIERVGLVTDDAGRVGCSPDGLIGDDGGIEIKCPRESTHVRYLMDGGVPKDYLTQVHGAMFVTGRRWWKFMSYCRRFPPLLVTVERDEAIQEAIGKAVSACVQRIDALFAELVKRNGGEDPRSRRAFVRRAEHIEGEVGITP